MNVPYKEYLSTSRYPEGTIGQGMTQFTLKEPDHYRNRNILLVEDIIDEGFTLFDVVRELLRYGPKTITIAAMLNNPGRRSRIGFFQDKIVKYKDETMQEAEEELAINGVLVGYTIDSHFVVGHGLDRDLPHLCVARL